LNLPEGIQLKNLTHSQLLYDEKGCFEDLHTNHPEFRVFDRRGYVLIYESGKAIRKLPALQSIVSRDGIHSPSEALGKPFRGNPASAFTAVRGLSKGWPFPEIWVDQDGVYLFQEKSGMVRTLKSMPVDAARFVSLNRNAPMKLLLSSNDQLVCYGVVDQDGEALSFKTLLDLRIESFELHELAVLPKLPVPLDKVSIEATGEMKLTAMYESPRPTVATFDTNADSAWKIRHFQDPKTDQTESRLQHNLEYLSPAVVPPLYGAFLSAFTSNGLRSWDHLVYFLQVYPAFIYLVVFVMLSACAATAWACRRRRLSIRQTLQWCAATLLLGWGGPIAVLAIYTQPKFQRCPRCDKQRRIDQRTCEHCGAAWEPPSNEGIEIYDDPIIAVRSEVVSV
jgi:hypothetical protein